MWLKFRDLSGSRGGIGMLGHLWQPLDEITHIEYTEAEKGIEHVRVLPRWKYVFRRIARAGYFVRIIPDPRDGCVYAVEAYVLMEELPSGRVRMKLVAEAFGYLEDALMRLAGELGVSVW